MNIFLAGTSLSPAYGGPAYSVSRLASALAHHGMHVGLWTPDQSVETTSLLDCASGVRRLTGRAADALDAFGRPDVLHDNGLWLAHNHRLASVARARRIPRIVSTRGMLEPWALQHKRWKKRIAWRAYQRRDLLSARCLHATSEAEAGNLRELGLNIPVRVIPNGIALSDVDRRSAERGATRAALFLGRLYPVKGLPLLIEAWSRVRPPGWTLRIAGPDEGGHRRVIEAMVSAAGLCDAVSFTGPLDDEGKRAALGDADILVLPTHSESFGMVVGEALAHGVPVLTTTAAPWPMLERRGCGWQVQPTVEGLTGGLRRATSLDAETLGGMGMKGRALIAGEFQWDDVAAAVVAMYESAASR